MKILTIVGARPQFIKASALSMMIKKYDELEEVIVHTGQHFDKNMSDIFFEEMKIPQPKYNLKINSLSHGAMTGRMIEGIEEILIKEKPDFLLVYGDTNSTLAGALAASKLRIKVIHVEAGLRSFNFNMPEEINRILTDRISDFLFCPTQEALNNLQKEGYHHFDSKIELVGDVMEDAALFFETSSPDIEKLLIDIGLNGDNYFLCTIHRAENTGDFDRMTEIVEGLNSIAQDNNILIPVHPRTKKVLETLRLSPRIKLISPVGYLEMISLIKNSKIVLTDSGGLQKEAYFFNKFCVTLRDQTEWIELVENGFNILVGASSSNIVKAVDFFSDRKFVKNVPLYGGGNASQRIVDFLLKENNS